ncbi:Probable short-chain dehydrogenase/reductase [Pseudooceanicola batsensis HTCC2597]|uniref:Probable short-chain dehydrogenase/reductase n=1 Tax=Pseudooceanicola batsensis (strain ATCC BAA-863 / DSM 15984 / KCTC 12145 / HTCC2597) TaxID=252305 RepID=A3TUA3_PSEBH|nr:SDR family NAD(P)-dependent oxidoreductase [Pseudooceanicola batsensis]EAQ04099.1 Probable short-chain dehydrogenase/reductase [Pseudooceanicola batsensis HTCC2597]
MTRSILITGCSSGIGYASATALRAEGWRVFATCRAQADADRLASDGFETARLDYTDPGTIEVALDRVLAATGGTLDALHNNGAVALPGANEDLPRAGLQHVFETNLFGPHDLTRRVIPVMRRQGHGRIVNCSSVLGIVTAPWRSAYVASKFALEGLTDTLRIEMRDTPIHVILLQPGPIRTRIRENSTALFERYVDWEASARAEQYRRSLLTRLYDAPGRDRFELPPEAVARTLIRALEEPEPSARYRVTTPTRAMEMARRLLPNRALDWILSRA